MKMKDKRKECLVTVHTSADILRFLVKSVCQHRDSGFTEEEDDDTEIVKLHVSGFSCEVLEACTIPLALWIARYWPVN